MSAEGSDRAADGSNAAVQHGWSDGVDGGPSAARPALRAGSGQPPHVEGEHRTELPYGDGGVPVYVGVLWVLFIVTYLSAVFFLVIPDLLSWMKS